jgi:cobalt/nickel transport system permease protein
MAFRAAAGMLAVLFAKSYQRAEGVHRAMVARGFRGSFPLMAPQRLAPADAAFLLLTCAAPLSLRVAVP